MYSAGRTERSTVAALMLPCAERLYGRDLILVGFTPCGVPSQLATCKRAETWKTCATYWATPTSGQRNAISTATVRSSARQSIDSDNDDATQKRPAQKIAKT